ncbi:DUF6185 family protein [Streptomyces sp. NPDC051940]|uniref:DUF6185 family protein n=1 Tax=Streptomyces sp. NPDC051940 TaxID=3155675 RepID=UPI003438532C
MVALLGTPAASADDTDPCDAVSLNASPVSSRVELFERGSHNGTVVTETVMRIPKSWLFAEGLFFSPRSAAYREAMRCLVADGEGTEPRYAEERDNLPVVVAEGGSITVTDTVRLTIVDESSHDVGPWRIGLDAHGYELSLEPPPALTSATWKVMLVRDGNDLLTADPAPDDLSTDAEYIWSSLRSDDGGTLDLSLSAPWRIRAMALWGEYPQNVYVLAAHTACLLLVPVAYAVSRIRERRRGYGPPHVGVLSAAVGIQAVIAVCNLLDFGMIWALQEVRSDLLAPVRSRIRRGSPPAGQRSVAASPGWGRPVMPFDVADCWRA